MLFIVVFVEIRKKKKKWIQSSNREKHQRIWRILHRNLKIILEGRRKVRPKQIGNLSNNLIMNYDLLRCLIIIFNHKISILYGSKRIKYPTCWAQCHSPRSKPTAKGHNKGCSIGLKYSNKYSRRALQAKRRYLG